MIATRVVIGLAMTLVAFAIAGRRLVWLYRLIKTGQPSPGRLDGVGQFVRSQLVEVFGQRRLLKWSVPGLAHFFTFWGFVILGATIVEAYGALFERDFAIPLIGRSPVLGFLEDFFAVAVLAAIATFTVLRIRQAPSRAKRASRFYGSHTGAAWVILGMITAVIVTLLLYRAAQVNTGHFPFESGAFASEALAAVLDPLGGTANDVIETVFILAQIGVILGFLVLVVYSKHLHIFLAPLNVATKRRPHGLGPLLPMLSDGTPVDFEDPAEDDIFGVGKVEDFKWNAMLDFATCTECGRCQSVCPAWATDKPLSPKLVIMDLRDHLFAKAPHLLATDDGGGGGSDAPSAKRAAHPGVPESGFGRVPGSGPEQAERPLVGTLAEGGVIDPDVLWSCTTCGACVEECPVDIEHVDHIVDMRRHEVLVESEFPSELSGLFKNLEKAGNPWGMPATARFDWAKDLPFELKVVGSDVADLSEVEWLFWVGCAGAFEERAKKTTRAVAELLHLAGVDFAVLAGETCTGDPARRAGNEFLFHMLATENAETLQEARAVKIVATCAHCFNTLKNEYPQLGVTVEVIHHTQLLNRLVREGRLKPVAPAAGDGVNGETRPITYHDPCYIGRHNQVYSPPRDLIGALPGVEFREMPRNSERSFCCGAGGARMWMEERIGTRVNNERTREALETGAERIATGCPYCKVMLGDAVISAQSEGRASEDVEVLDVAQMLLAAVQRDGASS